MTLGRRNRVAASVTALSGLVAALVSWLATGSHGAVSAFVGCGLVLVFLSAGSIPFVVAGDGTRGRAGLGFLVLGLTYALRLVLALVVLKVTADVLDGTVVGLVVIACATVWTVTMLVIGLSRRHHPTLDL
ncbi:MAG: hypothetical protein WCD35_19430 [Mycobacteriales bacterium]